MTTNGAAKLAGELTKSCYICGIAPRTYHSYCKFCYKVKTQKYREENRSKINHTRNLWTKQDREKNPEKYRTRDKLRYLQNIEKFKEKSLRARANRIDAAREYDRRRNKARRKKNADYYRRKTVERRNPQRTPKWANQEKIQEIIKLSLQTGLQVDHIIPLRGKNVSGLNVETNLQLLSARDNMTKWNRFNDSKYQEWRKNGEAGPYLPY